MKKKSKKKVLPAMAPKMKETMTKLQDQADEITVSDYVAQNIKPSGMSHFDFMNSRKSFEPIKEPALQVKSEPLFPLGFEFRKDYNVMLDCAAIFMFSTGFTSLGYWLALVTT